jgi:NAD(P)-dependent dehydrogenase (short-subunit alcohol dehydrogenase family)
MVDRGLANPEMEKAYTAMIPMGRMGRPEEMAETILYLCSDSSSYVTGQVLIADGGWVAQ